MAGWKPGGSDTATHGPGNGPLWPAADAMVLAFRTNSVMADQATRLTLARRGGQLWFCSPATSRKPPGLRSLAASRRVTPQSQELPLSGPFSRFVPALRPVP
jgi:hypothetical protein